MKRLSLSVLAGVVATPAMACDLCSIYSAAQAHGEMGRGVFAGVAEQFTYFDTLQDNGQKVPNETGQYLASSISQVFAGYNFSDRVGLQLNLPVIYRSFQRPVGFETDRGTVSGIGDVSLIASVAPYQRLTETFTFSWNVLGGVKFPTGNTDRITEEFFEIDVPGAPVSGIHGHDLTLGTGSYDGIVATGFFTRWRRWFLAANVQYTIRSTGAYDYRFANDLTWIGGPGYYLLLSHNNTLSLQAVVSGEHKGLDTFQGESAEDTGITAVYLGPAVSFTWSNKLSVSVGADLPVSIDNTSLQAVPNYRVRGAVNWRF